MSTHDPQQPTDGHARAAAETDGAPAQARPQYGEPAAANDPRVLAAAAASAAAASTSAEDAPPTPSTPLAKSQPSTVSAVTDPATPGTAVRRPRFFTTIMLLAFGFVGAGNMIKTGEESMQLFEQLYRQLSITAPVDPSVFAGVIEWNPIIQSVLWMLTAAVSLTLIRQQRRSWYVPLIGGALSFLALLALLTAAMFTDPNVMEAIRR